MTAPTSSGRSNRKALGAAVAATSVGILIGPQIIGAEYADVDTQKQAEDLLDILKDEGMFQGHVMMHAE